MREVKYRKLFGKRKFEPERWKETLRASCYYYAINVECKDFVLVGETIGKRCNDNVSDEELFRILKEELKATFNYEVEEVDLTYKARKGEFKIYLERGKHRGYYHFFREDADGSWSDKRPGEFPQQQNLEERKKLATVGWCFKLKEKEGAVK